MKKIFTIASVFALGLVITFACKKSTTTTPPASTTSTTGSNSTVTSLTIDGTAASGITASGGAGSGVYQLYASNPTNLYPEVEISFSGTVTPSGSYAISAYSNTVTPAANHCYLQYYPSFSGSAIATSGVVTVTAGTPSNTAVFSNIVCSGTSVGTHTLSGTFKF